MRAAGWLALCLVLPAIAGEPNDVMVADASREAYTRPFPGLSDTERERFFRGRSLFRQSWVVAPAADREVAGLGPLYNRLACISCHPRNGRGRAPDGPEERMQSMLVRLSVPGVDGHGGPLQHPIYGGQLNEEGIPGVPGEGRAALAWEPVTVTLDDGERVVLRRPIVHLVEPGYGPFGAVLTSLRIGQPVYGDGLLDAVDDVELERLAAETQPDGVAGRVNRVWDEARKQTVVGRFGFKANMPNLRQQIAGAMIGDLGLTSSLFPEQNCTPVQIGCLKAPAGSHPELSGAQLDDLEFYLAHLAVPARREVDNPRVRQGEHLFTAIGCAACHRPQLMTGAQARFPHLTNRVIAPYTDLLLHDLGEALSDQRPDYLAGGRDWRTAPLWGIGLAAKVGEEVGYLHDGRARNVQEAILWHGGEAALTRGRFAALSPEERKAMLAFIGSL